MLSLLIGAALAGAPGAVLPVPVAPDTPQLFASLSQDKGVTGPAGELACEPLGGLQLCYKLESQGKRRFVTRADLSAWEMSPAQLRAAAAGELSANPLVQQQAEGGAYFRPQAPTGREAVVLLHPEWLATVGPKVAVGVPADGVLVIWRPGDPTLDKMVAVGVHRMYEELPSPVSPQVQSWDGQRWTVWGQARPNKETP